MVVGPSREFHCTKCGLVGHRDLLASRNIALLNSFAILCALIDLGYDPRNTVWALAVDPASIRKSAAAAAAAAGAVEVHTIASYSLLTILC